MFSIICLFPWMPFGYNFRVGIMRVFNIPGEEIVDIRPDRHYSTVMFQVASQEVFDHLKEFYCHILYFPLLGQNILECFAYPESPQYQLLRLSVNPTNDMGDSFNEFLSRFGTVLYQRHLCYTAPLISGFRTDSIGVVLLRFDRSKKNPALPANVPPISQRSPGNGQEAVTVVPPVPLALPSSVGTTYYFPGGPAPVGSQQPLYSPGLFSYHGTAVELSGNPYQHQVLQISAMQDNGAHRYDQNFRRQWSPSDHGNHSYRRYRRRRSNYSATMRMSSAPQASVQEKHAPQAPVGEECAPQVPVGEESASQLLVGEQCALQAPVEEECALQAPVEEECARQVPVGEECAPQVPVGEEGAPEAPVGEEGAPEVPVGEERAPQAPVGEQHAPQAPVGEQHAPQAPVGEECAPQAPVGEQYAPQAPVGEECAPQVPVGEQCGPQVPLGEERAPQTPVEEKFSTEEPVEEKHATEKPPLKDECPSENLTLEDENSEFSSDKVEED